MFDFRFTIFDLSELWPFCVGPGNFPKDDNVLQEARPFKPANILCVFNVFKKTIVKRDGKNHGNQFSVPENKIRLWQWR